MSALKMELYKLFYKKSGRFLVVLFFVLLIGVSIAYVTSEWRLGINLMNAGQFIGASLAITMGFFLPVITLYSAGTLFSEEFSQVTINNLLLVPIKRSAIYWGKQLALFSFVGILLGLQLVYSLFFSLLVDGGFSFSLLLTSVGAYLGAWILLGIIAHFGALAALLLRSSGLMIVISYLAYVFMGVLGLYIPLLRPILFNTLLKAYNTLLTQVHWSQLLVVIAYYIMVSTIANTVFEYRLGNTTWESQS